MKVALIIAVVLVFLADAQACGKERWSVKVLTDPAARSIAWKAQDSTISGLSSEPGGDFTTRQPFEQHVYRIHATITDVKLEADGDVHLVLSDGGQTMIAESPNVSCTYGAQHRYAMAVARQALDAKLNPSSSWQAPNLPATLTGVGFLDRLHGQRGVARNGVELHPLLRVSFKA